MSGKRQKRSRSTSQPDSKAPSEDRETDRKAAASSLKPSRKIVVSEEELRSLVHAALTRRATQKDQQQMNYIIGACADARQLDAVVRLCNLVARTSGVSLTDDTWSKLGHLHDHRGFVKTLTMPPLSDEESLLAVAAQDVSNEDILHRLVKGRRVKEAAQLAQRLLRRITGEASGEDNNDDEDALPPEQRQRLLDIAASTDASVKKTLVAELCKTFSLKNKLVTPRLVRLLEQHVGFVRPKAPKVKKDADKNKFEKEGRKYNRHDMRRLPKSTNPKRNERKPAAPKSLVAGIRPSWSPKPPSAPAESKKLSRSVVSSSGFVRKRAMQSKPKKTAAQKKQRR